MKNEQIGNIKICLVISDLNKGGMQRVMSELANYFGGKTDAKVELILLTSEHSIFYKVLPSVKIHKPTFKFDRRWRFISTLKTLYYLRMKIRNVKPNVVLSFGEMYNSFVLLSTLLLNVRVFISDRSKPDKNWGFIHNNLRKLLYPYATGIIAQTNFAKEFLTNELKHENIEVIPNPIKLISATTQERDNIILNVGRIIKSKRLDLLLEIFSKVNNTGWQLWIIGDDEGNEKENLETLARKFGIENKVKILGKQENIIKFYKRAKIFAFTSESEGFPNVLLEAMAADMASISFDCIAGPNEIISDNKNGYLIEMYDIESYVKKLNILIADHDKLKEISFNARSSVEKYAIETIGQQFYNFLSRKNE